MNKRLKVIHIHNDKKFIDITKGFEGPYFENFVVVIGEKGNYKGFYENSACYFKPSLSNVKKIISLCTTADLVVFYNLDNIKSFIANQLPEKVKKAWRFFGTELYKKIPEVVYSDLTQNVLNETGKSKLNELVKRKINQTKSLLKWRRSFEKEFERAIPKIDFFIGLCKEEYDFLKTYWGELPNFIQLPVFLKREKSSNHQKKDLIIVGNNRSAYNNHLDVLKLIKENNMIDATFVMPFNYGVETLYSKKVRDAAKSISNVELLEDFLTVSEYEMLFKKAKAAVFNGYRQMAMANVFFAIRNDVKLYLNKKNIVLEWLRNEGFFVFTIQDFQNDLKNNNLMLSKNEASHNASQFKKLENENNLEIFQKKIYTSALAIINK